MFTAINDNVILRKSSEVKTDSGIILTNKENKSPEYEVIATTEETKKLQDKKIYAQKITLLKEDEEYSYYSVSYKDILAIVT